MSKKDLVEEIKMKYSNLPEEYQRVVDDYVDYLYRKQTSEQKEE